MFLKNNSAPPVNLIIVDWGKLAQPPWYNDAAKNTHLVGVKVARFIEFLVAQGTLSDQMHVIGHSLGSHVAGFAGSNLNNITLSRITGICIRVHGALQDFFCIFNLPLNLSLIYMHT